MRRPLETGPASLLPYGLAVAVMEGREAPPVPAWRCRGSCAPASRPPRRHPSVPPASGLPGRDSVHFLTGGSGHTVTGQSTVRLSASADPGASPKPSYGRETLTCFRILRAAAAILLRGAPRLRPLPVSAAAASGTRWGAGPAAGQLARVAAAHTQPEAGQLSRGSRASRVLPAAFGTLSRTSGGRLAGLDRWALRNLAVLAGLWASTALVAHPTGTHVSCPGSSRSG